MLNIVSNNGGAALGEAKIRNALLNAFRTDRILKELFETS